MKSITAVLAKTVPPRRACRVHDGALTNIASSSRWSVGGAILQVFSERGIVRVNPWRVVHADHGRQRPLPRSCPTDVSRKGSRRSYVGSGAAGACFTERVRAGVAGRRLGGSCRRSYRAIARARGRARLIAVSRPVGLVEEHDRSEGVRVERRLRVAVTHRGEARAKRFCDAIRPKIGAGNCPTD
jgi:hypothetical protein